MKYLVEQSVISKELLTLDVDIYNNRVYLNIAVNDKEGFDVILDSGAATSALSLSVARRLNIKLGKSVPIAGNGESPTFGYLARDVSFQLEKLTFSKHIALVLPTQELEAREGRRVDGILGMDFLSRYAVEIDYRNRLLAIYEAGCTLPYTEEMLIGLQGQTLPVVRALITFNSNKKRWANLVIDSGTYSPLRLFTPFIQDAELQSFLASAEQSTGFGIGGDYRERLMRVASLDFAQVHLENVVTHFSTAESGVTTSRAFDGTIGGAILCQFKLILDYPNRWMILSPNR